MIIGEFAKRICDCQNRHLCPVVKFNKINYKLPNGPIPLPWWKNINLPRGHETELMIIGINPGGKEEDVSNWDFNNYMLEDENIGDILSWPYHENYECVIEIFGQKEESGVVVTNLVLCPTPHWARDLSNEEKEKTIELCSPFCLEIIQNFNPKFIFLHGLDVIKFFGKHYNWNLAEDLKSKDINGRIEKGNGRKFVLSQHLTSIPRGKTEEAWKEKPSDAGRYLR